MMRERLEAYAAKRDVLDYLDLCEREMPSYTQKRAITFTLLRQEGKWVCGSYFLTAFIPTYAQRISELVRKDGEPIESQECRNPAHRHRSTVHAYRWNKEDTSE